MVILAMVTAGTAIAAMATAAAMATRPCGLPRSSASRATAVTGVPALGLRELHASLAHQRTRRSGRHERVVAPPSVQGGDCDDADALSEAVAIARGPPAHAGGIARCRVGRLCRRLSTPRPVQPQIRPALR